jgi:hypothetical protein
MFDLNLAVMKLLAVAGGAALGYLLIAALVRFARRLSFRDQIPRPIHIAVRLLGAFAGGFLVWLWLFGGGSGGLGGGGGWWPFGRSGSFGGNGGVEKSGAAKKPSEPERPREVPRGEAVQVVMLGGAGVKDQRFYQLDGEGEAATFSELTKTLAARRQEKPSIAVLRIMLHKDSVDRDNPAVTQLERWARDNGLTPELVTP